MLHYVIENNTEEVSSFEEIRTAKRTFQDDYNSGYGMNGKPAKEKDDKIMLKPSEKVAKPFRIAPGILCEVTVVTLNVEDRRNPTKTKTTTIRVFSHTLKVAELRKFVNVAMDRYDTYMKEEVEKNQFYFITKLAKPEAYGGMGGSDELELAYDEYKFNTSRTFSNIFYKQKDELKRRLDFFLNNRAWYEERGIPYTLGFLFHGPPGTGKTSTIKAMANYTKRHIVEVSLGRIRTYRDLQRVFHETTFCEKFIPHHKIIYVLEDIDCLSDIVKTRSGKKNKEFEEIESKSETAKSKPKTDAADADDSDDEAKDLELSEKVKGDLDDKAKIEFEKFKEFQRAWNKDPLTLSHLLNILDGILETPGRILIITSNHPEKLDEALIRPGRVDMRVEFGNATVEDTVNVLEMFFKYPVASYDRSRLSNLKYSAAQIYNICFQSKTMDEAIERLQHEKPVVGLARSSSNIPLRMSSSSI